MKIISLKKSSLKTHPCIFQIAPTWPCFWKPSKDIEGQIRDPLNQLLKTLESRWFHSKVFCLEIEQDLVNVSIGLWQTHWNYKIFFLQIENKFFKDWDSLARYSAGPLSWQVRSEGLKRLLKAIKMEWSISRQAKSWDLFCPEGDSL